MWKPGFVRPRDDGDVLGVQDDHVGLLSCQRVPHAPHVDRRVRSTTRGRLAWAIPGSRLYFISVVALARSHRAIYRHWGVTHESA